MTPSRLVWQSKTVLLLVLPVVGANVVLQAHWWATQSRPVAIWTLGLSLLLGLVALKMRSATVGGAATGAAITATLMFSTVEIPYLPWRTALVPVLVLMVLTSLATRTGRHRKEQLGTAEQRSGREASQVSANLGIAAILANQLAQVWMSGAHWLGYVDLASAMLFAPALAALCEAAADTVSSELGQVLSSTPRMITSLRVVEPGTDGAISAGGTLAGALAAAAVAAAGSAAMGGGMRLFAVSCGAGIFGLLFDSVLGATLEQRRWLNNDAVNFLSTAAAAAFALLVMAILVHTRLG